MPAADSTVAIETVYRVEFPKVVAVLARFTGDMALAEDLAQDALADALRQWPRDGTPRNPGAWLTAVAKRKAIDAFRRDRTLAAKYAQIGHELQAQPALDDGDDASLCAESSEGIDDDRVRLIFVACHPVLALPARVALTLRLVGGLTVPEIARAYVVPEATIAQRIVRAKRTVARAEVPFEVPAGVDRLSRLDAVLEVIYLIFNEGYSATAGEDWVRPELCGEALRLGRVLAVLVPDEPEVHGLVALMEFQSSRLRARTGPTGSPVLLLDQDRRIWDRLHIGRGEAALARADGARRHSRLLHAAGRYRSLPRPGFRPEETDWDELVALYASAARTTSSPIVELNRAVAISWASGPADALALVDLLVGTGTLDRYHLLYSVRGDLLDRLGRHKEAASEFERAAALVTNGPERTLLSERARGSRSVGGSGPDAGLSAPTLWRRIASPDGGQEDVSRRSTLVGGPGSR